MRPRDAPDAEIARRAAAQGGVVSHAQLRAAGLSPEAIKRRVWSGRLHALHRRVYAVGHEAVGREGRRWAAVLAFGDAYLSHGSAAAAWGIAAAPAAIHVTVRGRAGLRSRDGIRVHRPRALPDDEVATLRGLPITTPARTLLDLAATGRRAAIAVAVDRAEQLRLIDFAELHALLDRYPARAGTPSLKAVLTSYTGPADVRSHLERLVHDLCERQQLPAPHVNVVIEGSVRDFAWPRQRLVVEADSYAWHRSPAALNADRERDVALTLGGWRVLRFTSAQLTRRRAWVARSLTAALGAA